MTLKVDRKKVAKGALAGLLALVAAFLIALALLWPRCRAGVCPSVDSLLAYQPPQASEVLDRDGRLLARLAPEQRIVVPITSIPRKVAGAFLSVEDRRFYQHHGIDWRRVGGAFWRNLKSLRLREGSSTLTMQLSRNVFPDQIGPPHSLRRKLGELVLAREIEAKLPKDRILELYLNQIYLGNGLYGVEAAARGYFGKSVRDLTPAQAALLASLPKAPTSYDPRRFPDAAHKRRDLVLTLMAQEGYLTPAELKKAQREKIKLVPLEEPQGAPWFIAAVRRELHDRLGPEADRLGLRVRTGLDMKLQRSAEKELVQQISAVEKRSKKTCGKDPDECLEGLFVAVDPATGDVRALVGGRDYSLSEFDRVTQARRQAGSAFKPIVWTAALQAGIPLTTLLGDSTADYQPADRISLPVGPLNLREALRVSSNRAAVALGERVGVSAVIEEARILGLTTPIGEYPSTVLGAAAVEPLELVLAYAAFANGGDRIEPRFIDHVESAAGLVLWQAPVTRSAALTPGVAYMMTSLLSDVVDRGTGMAARREVPADLPLFGKTGTTNDAQDVWFVGATPELVGAVWLGYDQPRSLGKSASGGRLAAPVFGRVLRSYYMLRPKPLPWLQPPELEVRDVDLASGGLAIVGCPPDRVARELFLPGTAPQDCPEHHGGVVGLMDKVGRWLGSH
ncbi:MAG: PBP1A family penicillin-binding protein [Deltaproteobacteria bacterium]|nr:MAG: PBP1A family penicillin-binding protein [Deltaproteobacteria bacterium]